MPDSFEHLHLLGFLSLHPCGLGELEEPEKPGLTDVLGRANMPPTMKSIRAFFFYAYFYGAPKAAVASR
jgi:hypothetical protein